MELFVFSQDEQLLTIISEDTGLVEAPYRIEVNSVPTEPFSFTVKSDQKVAEHVKEENKVVFKDHEGDWRLMNIKEVDDSNNSDGPVTIATCEPAFLAELNEHIVVDRRFVNQTADVVLAAAVEGTRWQASVEVELGKATINFYYVSSMEAIWKTIETWGGEFKDIVNFDEITNTITGCYVKILQRLGAENGQRFEIDHNTTEIGRTVLSYPKTALYGRGSSLEVEDDNGNHTGGYTRYIDFADVEWRTSRGDPVDKPKGQKWVGDPEALKVYGYEGKTKHRFGIFSNQDYEEPADLLQATWEALQDAKKPEVNYRLSVQLFDEKVSLGDTCQAIDRMFSRPIEIQARVIAMEYDLLDIEGTMVVEMGQFLDLGDRIDDLEKEVENIKNNPPKIGEGSYPNIKPGTPIDVEAYGGMEVIQLYWDYASQIYVKHYEVYGSRTEDFVPDSQHLLWRGNTSAFAHTVGTDEVWYYRIRAVNYHGTPSDWSVQVRAATHRVTTEDILWGPELAERMRELHRISDIIGENGIDFNQISEEAKDLINQQARIYTDQEVDAVRDSILERFEEIDDYFEYLETEVNVNRDAIEARVEQIVYDRDMDYLNNSLAEIIVRADGIEQTVRSIEIGGRNLASISAVKRWGTGVMSMDDYRYTLTNPDGLSNVGLSVDKPKFEDSTDYVVSFKIRKKSGVVNSLGGHVTRSGEMVIYRDGVFVGNNWPQGVDFGNSDDIHEYIIYFKTSVIDSSTSHPFYIQPNRPDYGQEFSVEIWDFQVEEGNKKTSWRPAPEDMENRMTIAESDIIQLADDITLKVNVDEIVSEINLKKEGIRISGNLIHLDGLTLIDKGIIQNAHIANGTIERAKLVRAIIGEAQIEDGAITNAKIANLNADKLTAGAIRGIDIYGSQIHSSNSLTKLTVVGGNVELNQNNGRYVRLNPEGIFGYYASGAEMFRADSLLVTSRALGTTSSNVYLAPGSNYEARIVDISDVPSDGDVESYRYRPIRASGIFANYIQNNVGAPGNNLYARPAPGGEFRVTGANTTDVYYPIRAGDIRGSSFITTSTSAWIGTDNELRVVDKSLSGTYRNVRANIFYGIAIDLTTTTSNVNNMYVRPTGTGSVLITARGTTNNFRPIKAREFITDTSLRENKKDINVFTQNTLETWRNANIYTYHRNKDDTNSKLQLGMMFDEMPSITHSDSNDSFALYALISYVAKGVKDTITYIDDEVNWQRVEYQGLKNKVTKLEERVEELEEMVA